MTQHILKVDNLVTHFPIKAGVMRRQVGAVHAVDGVSLAVAEKETLGIVGESGCGKTTLGRTILRLEEPTSGDVYYKGENIVNAGAERMRELRADLQIVFQDPYASLNPRHSVNDIVAEPLLVQGWKRDAAYGRVGDLLDAVGLLPEHGNRFPHEFSGGQRQRIGIARALALEPNLIILDEPVSALDVSVQAQVINLLEDLQNEHGLTYMFIAHDLSVVRHISDRIAVMYLGKVAELADRDELYDSPAHPYTHSLLSAVPVADPDIENARNRIVLEGDIPSPSAPPSGCRFRTRCPIVQDKCSQVEPEFTEVRPGHFVACHYPIPAGQSLVELVGTAS